jgi:hypothetical protein
MMTSTLIPESLKEILKRGLQIEDLCSRYYPQQYIIITANARFTFDGETVEELYEYCAKFDNSYVEYFKTIMAYVALNHYEIFNEWTSNGQANIIDILEDSFGTFTNLLVLWHQPRFNPDNSLPDKIYKLITRIFDDFVDKNFDYNDLWSTCLEHSILARDPERFVNLLEIFEMINLEDAFKEDQLVFNLIRHGKILLEIYPQFDASSLNFRRINNYYVQKYMVKCGYKMDNQDLIHLLNARYTGNTKNEIDQLCLNNWHLANLTDAFIDECFAAAVRNCNLKIMKMLLENYTPNRIIRCYQHARGSFNIYFLPAVIFSKHIYKPAASEGEYTELLKYIDFSEFTDEVMQQIFEMAIITYNGKIGLELIDLVNPPINVSDSQCKEFILTTYRKSLSCPSNINRDVILLMIKFGCTIDEEFLYQILEFIDVDTLDMVLQMLNLTLDDVPQQIIMVIVTKYVDLFNDMLVKICNRIAWRRKIFHITSPLKEKLPEVRMAYEKHPICALDKIDSTNDYGGERVFDTKIDIDLFVKLYKHTADSRKTDENILESADKVTKAFIEIVDRCYTPDELNKNNGQIPAPIMWSENVNSIVGKS